MAPMQQMLLLAAMLFQSIEAAADPKGTAALEKVIKMLAEVQQKVENELYEETRTYTKFEDFCTDTKEEKESAIADGEANKKAYEATILQKTSRIGSLEGEISGLETKIDQTQKNISTLNSDRKAAKATYEADKHELATGIQGLTRAINGLKTNPDEFKLLSFLQRPDMHKATALANFLGLKSDAAEKVMAMQKEPSSTGEKDDSSETSLVLSQRRSVPYQYSFDVSRDLKETLDKLLDDFRDARNTMDLDEMKAHSTYSKTKQAKMQQLAQHERDKQTAQSNKDAATKAKAQAEKSLASTEKDLADDNAYLSDIIQMCQDKKDAWDLRKKAREDEIEAIKEALTIMNDQFDKPKEDEKPAMVQVSTGVENTRLAALEEAEAAAEAAEAASSKEPAALVKTSKAGFLQMRSTSHHVERENRRLRSPQQEVEAMLRSKSVELQSPMFLALAKSVKEAKADDPLGNVKAMMQDLIKDMESEAGQDLHKKEVCEEEISNAEEERGTASAEVTRLNAAMAAGEASRDQLVLDIKTIKKELQELADAKDTATNLRSEQKAENEAAVQEAEAGFVAVTQALGALNDFYANAHANKTESVTHDAERMPTKENTTGAAKDAVDVGYDDSKAYAGAGESATVLGMLEVVKSDFNRTRVETKAEEDAAEAEFQAFLRNTSTSVGEKEGTKAAKISQKDSVEEQLEQDERALKDEARSLTFSLDKLAGLAKQCHYVSNSEKRIAKRAEEIKQLENAVTYVTKLMDDLKYGK
eukprot:TRINITY_DN25076_c0_g1_i1.p1 TRINITY_DN25076_c0_g1~~TRINITY_DN25076_c0_g1_i1.p1  ORF type:complete len:760 (+),score=264.51 TRINITY_DN25076_c0_g1_i1:59-2338(+)